MRSWRRTPPSTRTDALLRTGSLAVVMADLALQMELGRQELDQIEQEQQAIEAAINAMGAHEKAP